MSLQNPPNVLISWLERISQQTQPKTWDNYYLPFLKFFALKMSKSNIFFGGGHIEFIPVLQSIIKDVIQNLNLDMFRKYNCDGYNLVSFPAMMCDCCDKLKSILLKNDPNADVCDTLIFLDNTLEIAFKDTYLLGYNCESLLKFYSKQELIFLKNDIKQALWNSSNPYYSQQEAHQMIRDKIIPAIEQKLKQQASL